MFSTSSPNVGPCGIASLSSSHDAFLDHFYDFKSYCSIFKVSNSTTDKIQNSILAVSAAPLSKLAPYIHLIKHKIFPLLENLDIVSDEIFPQLVVYRMTSTGIAYFDMKFNQFNHILIGRPLEGNSSNNLYSLDTHTHHFALQSHLIPVTQPKSESSITIKTWKFFQVLLLFQVPSSCEDLQKTGAWH